MVWGGTKYFKNNAINNLKSTFKFSSDKTKTFVYIGIELTWNSDYNISIEQNNYIASISEISPPGERMSNCNSPLKEAERTQYRSVVGQLNWVPRISRTDQYKVQKCDSSRYMLC